MINYIHIVTLKELVVESLEQQITTNDFETISRLNPNIIISKDYSVAKDLIFIKKVKDRYIFLKKDYLMEKLKYRINLLFIWESILIVCVVVVYYFTVHKLITHRERYINILEVFSLVFNHKLRNFISVMRFNINDLSIRSNKRLYEASMRLENDVELFNGLISMLKKEVSLGRDLKDVVNDIVSDLSLNYTKEVKIKLSGKRYKLSTSDLYFVLYILLENAFKYGNKLINIRSYQMRGRYYIVIKNDISDEIKTGLGVGLATVESLCKRNRFLFKINKKSNLFIAVVSLKVIGIY
ncbi:MAG: hypothetical protein K6348_05940 [Deferribacterales bacterium]